MSTNFSQDQNTLPAANPAGLSPTRSAEMKAPGAFRTISEVAADLSIPQHVLRFWESKFQQIRPLKRGGGRRYYRPEDVQLLTSIKELLYSQGLTIRGVQKLLREGGRSPLARTVAVELPSSITSLSTPSSQQMPRGLSAEKRRDVEAVLNELKSLRELLRQSGI